MCEDYALTTLKCLSFEIGRVSVISTLSLFPGQTEKLVFSVPVADGSTTDTYQARIFVDPVKPTFRECRDDNNTSGEVKASCAK